MSEILQIKFDRIGGVMVSVVTPSAVDRGLEPQSDQSTEYKLVCVASPLKHAALMSKSKDWLARNQNTVSEWGDMSIHGLLY